MEAAERVGDRHGDTERTAAEIADEQHVPPPQPVDPDACRKREQKERQELDRAEERDLERGRVQHEHGDRRQRELRDRRAELADRLAAPQLHEVAVAPEASLRVAKLPHCYAVTPLPRAIRMSPLTEFARSSTLRPSAAGGSSPTGISDAVLPLTDLSSIQTAAP